MRLSAFLDRFDALPTGYSEGFYRGRRYGVTKSASSNKRRSNLFAEALGGADRVSFNLYRLSSGESKLKPCEMPAEKVIDFVLGFEPGRGAL